MNDSVPNLSHIRCIIVDFGHTLSSDLYFKHSPPQVLGWHETVQNLIFNRPDILDPCLRGRLRLPDIAGILAGHLALPFTLVIETLRRGVMDLQFNPIVWNFVRAQRSQGRKTALVTLNMDLFTDIVVPSHHLTDLFDVIINSADHDTLDKSILWELAFDRLGGGIDYSNSLLIEDGTKHTTLFRHLGGIAYQYTTDIDLEKWLRS